MLNNLKGGINMEVYRVIVQYREKTESKIIKFEYEKELSEELTKIMKDTNFVEFVAVIPIGELPR